MSRASRGSTPRVSKVKHAAEQTNIPFSEWIDSEINTEKWDLRIKDAKKPLITKKLSSRLSTTSENHVDSDVFHDTHIVHLPKSIEVEDWKRPNEIYENVEFVISKPYTDFTSLREGSIHILHSQFMRSFLNSICILEYVSTARPWEIESVSHNYVPNADNLHWKAWHHVYSFCGAGKGHQHNPKYNPTGKYIVRLHWLGSWRKIYVDDKLPLDKDNNILLPGFKFVKDEGLDKVPSNLEKPADVKSNSSKKDKKSSKSSKGSKGKKADLKKTLPEVELWPYILSKALLKIACLSWTEDSEIVDFNPISCLTGWICQKIDTAEMSTTDIWDICVAYSPKFEWDEDKETRPKTSKSSKSSKKDSSKKGSNKQTTSSKGKKGENKETEEIIDETKVYCLVGSCKSIKDFIKELDIEDVPSEWNQEFLIEQSRDKTLTKQEPQPELPRWKRFRWLKWAISKGLWSADDLSTPIKCLKLYNNFKKTEPPPIKTVDKSHKGKKGGDLKIFPLVDQSVWVEFADVEIHIDTLYIFFRPSQFPGRAELSNNKNFEPTAHHAKDKSKKGEEKPTELKWSLNIRESRNEPLYLLMDSLERKLLIINLNQTGHVSRIATPCLPVSEEPYANAVLEDFVWQENRLGKIHIFLRTVGSKTVLVYLGPGRVTCKLWIWCNNDYFLSVLCNVQVTIGNVDNVFDGMCAESLLLAKVAQEAGIAFGNLVQAFGTPDYKEHMHAFCKTYTNGLHLTKLVSKQLYNEFMDTLLQHLESKAAAYAMKILFIDPNIAYKGLKKTESYTYSICEHDIGSYISDDEITQRKIQERAATKIQSILKCIYIRKLVDMHKQSNKKYYEVYEQLKKIYFELFADNKRPVCMKILKEFFLRSKDLSHSYLYKDLLKTVEIKAYKGSAIIPSTTDIAGTWVFITRQKFINKSHEPLMLRVALFVNLPKYVVRIFNNDDLKEVKRSTNNTEGYFYPPNQKGFTILCYGWVNEATKLTWKLYLIYQKTGAQTFITSEEVLDTKMLNHSYTPNVNANICKCKLEIRQNADITLRLSTSGAKAELDLRVRDSSKQIVAKVQGKQNIILPLVRLNCLGSVEEDEFRASEVRRSLKSSIKSTSKQRVAPVKIIGPSSIYYIEGAVLNNSWPLTKKEWLTVKMERSKNLLRPPPILDSPQQINSKKKLTSVSVDIQPAAIETPCWTLQLVHNIGENLNFEYDLTRRNEINSIKESWYSEDPDRYERSQEIRQNYLQGLCSPTDEESAASVVLSINSQSTTELNRWIPETMMLTPFTLSEYYFANLEEPIYPDLVAWESSLMDKSRDELHTLAFTLSQCRERMDRVENDQIENFIILRQWYSECRADSADLMKESYALRSKFIDILIDENTKPQDAKEKKGDKKKDKKEGKKKK